MVDAVKEVVEDRGKTYGSYEDVACTIKEFEELMGVNAVCDRYPPPQEHALRMIAVKLARLAKGDPTHADSFLDISGYAKLAYEDLVVGEKDA